MNVAFSPISNTLNIQQRLFIVGLLVSTALLIISEANVFSSAICFPITFAATLTCAVMILAIYFCRDQKTKLNPFHGYFNVIEENGRFRIVSSSQKPQLSSSGNGLLQLQKIQRLLREKVVMVGQMVSIDPTDETIRNMLLSSHQTCDEQKILELKARMQKINRTNDRARAIRALKESARIITDNFLNKSSNIAWLYRFFGQVSQKEAQITSLNREIQSYSDNQEQFASLSTDLIHQTMQYLSPEDFSPCFTVSKEMNRFANRASINYARRLGYVGNQELDAKNYILALVVNCKELESLGLIPERIKIFQRQKKSFKVLDVHRTLLNFSEMKASEWLPFFSYAAIMVNFERYFLKIVREGNFVRDVERNSRLNELLFSNVNNNNLIRTEILLLLGAQANVRDSQGRNSVLEIAAARGNINLVRLLLNYGAPMNIGGSCRALYYAILYGHEPMIRFLLEQGASTRHALNYLARYGVSAEIFREISNKDPGCINERDINGNTPLLIAIVTYAREWMIRELLSLGANPDLVDPDFRGGQGYANLTPLMAAIRMRHTVAINLLLVWGADLKILGVGNWSTLHESCMAGNLELVKLCLDQGMDIDAQDERGGGTPLIYAAMSRSTETIQFLLQRGANVNMRDRFGATAADRCRLASDFENLSLIESMT